MTLTLNDLQAIGKLFDKKLEHVATKQDLVPFATKQDLAPFATKQDLAPFATKKDLAPFATKHDLVPFATKQDLAPFATKQDVKEIVKGNTSILGTIFKVELTSTAKEIMKVILVLNRKMEQQGKRIDRLEEHAGQAKN